LHVARKAAEFTLIVNIYRAHRSEQLTGKRLKLIG
jgi:hypothetical protein